MFFSWFLVKCSIDNDGDNMIDMIVEIKQGLMMMKKRKFKVVCAGGDTVVEVHRWSLPHAVKWYVGSLYRVNGKMQKVVQVIEV